MLKYSISKWKIIRINFQRIYNRKKESNTIEDGFVHLEPSLKLPLSFNRVGKRERLPGILLLFFPGKTRADNSFVFLSGEPNYWPISSGRTIRFLCNEVFVMPSEPPTRIPSLSLHVG